MKDSLEIKMNQWQTQAKDYPTKAILHTAYQMYKVQQQRIEQARGQLDGQAWSPSSWNSYN